MPAPLPLPGPSGVRSVAYGLPLFVTLRDTGVSIPDLPSLIPTFFHPRRDTETLIGLPRPIHESVKTLKQVRWWLHVQLPAEAAQKTSRGGTQLL